MRRWCGAAWRTIKANSAPCETAPGDPPEEGDRKPLKSILYDIYCMMFCLSTDVGVVCADVNNLWRNSPAGWRRLELRELFTENGVIRAETASEFWPLLQQCRVIWGNADIIVAVSTKDTKGAKEHSLGRSKDRNMAPFVSFVFFVDAN